MVLNFYPDGYQQNKQSTLMAVVAQYLFGSHARRDDSVYSDVDLLSIINEERFSVFSEGKLNISCYPMPRFIEAASRGDLFVMHIVREAIVVYDPTSFHSIILKKFRAKQDYNFEIKQASDLGWYLIKEGRKFRNQKVWNKRIAWCARTILIARTAEMGSPVFSTDQLVKLFNFSDISLILARKNENCYDGEIQDKFYHFLGEYGTSSPNFVKFGDTVDVWWYFQKNSNRIALATMESVIDSVEKDIYGAL